jgi:hypothetical protein
MVIFIVVRQMHARTSTKCMLTFILLSQCMQWNVCVHEQGICLLFLFPSFVRTNKAYAHGHGCAMMDVRVYVSA